MKLIAILFLQFFQHNIYVSDSTSYGFPFVESDFIAINQLFGKQKTKFYPFHINRRDYPGNNFEVKNTAPALAICSGKVEEINESKGFGKFIKINHGNSIKARYYHLEETKVEVGEEVKRGDIIGTSGATGLTTVNSIGLIIYSKGEKMDPQIFFKKELKSKK